MLSMWKTYIISNQEDLILNNEKLIKRKQISNEKTINLDELLIKSLDKIEEQEIFLIQLFTSTTII